MTDWKEMVDLSKVFCSLSKSPPFDHELLGRHWDIQLQLLMEELNKSLLVQDEGYMIDCGAVVDVDHLIDGLEEGSLF